MNKASLRNFQKQITTNIKSWSYVMCYLNQELGQIQLLPYQIIASAKLIHSDWKAAQNPF